MTKGIDIVCGWYFGFAEMNDIYMVINGLAK